MKNNASIPTVELPVTTAVATAVTDQIPPCAVYTLISVVINPAVEWRTPGL